MLGSGPRAEAEGGTPTDVRGHWRHGVYLVAIKEGAKTKRKNTALPLVLVALVCIAQTQKLVGTGVKEMQHARVTGVSWWNKATVKDRCETR